MNARRDLTQLPLTEQLRLFEDLDRREQLEAGNQRRRHKRFTFRTPHATVVHVKLGSNTDKHSVLMRNISAAGCSFLHNVFLYPQSACLIELRMIGGERPTTAGVIKRCTLVSGWVHEIGVQFAAAVDIDAFISEADRPKAGDGEDPAWLSGRKLAQKLKIAIEAHDAGVCKQSVDELIAWRHKLPRS